MMTPATGGTSQQCRTGQPCSGAATTVTNGRVVTQGSQQPLGDYASDDLPWDEDNPTTGGGGGVGGSGGEHDDENAAVLTMVRVTVRDSVAYGYGGGRGRGAWNGRGGAVAVLNEYAKATFSECTFIGNEAWGGEDSDDLFLGGYSDPIGSGGGDGGMAADYSTNLGEGGAVYISGASASFDRCTFEDQTAEKEGGAVYVDGGAATTFDGRGLSLAHNRPRV
jgi:hypothetical protein